MRIFDFLFGKKEESNFNSKGELDGIQTTFFNNGKISTIKTYKNGKRNGLWKKYYKNGNLKSKITFDNNGKENGTHTRYTESGKILSVINYKNGMKHGEDISYHIDSDIIEQKQEYVNDKKHGLKMYNNQKGEIRTKSYYEKGDLVTSAYIKDEKNGTFITYKVDGKLITDQTNDDLDEIDLENFNPHSNTYRAFKYDDDPDSSDEMNLIVNAAKKKLRKKMIWTENEVIALMSTLRALSLAGVEETEISKRMKDVQLYVCSSAAETGFLDTRKDKNGNYDLEPVNHLFRKSLEMDQDNAEDVLKSFNGHKKRFLTKRMLTIIANVGLMNFKEEEAKDILHNYLLKLLSYG